VAYRVHVAGSLDPRLVDWFDGLILEPGQAGDTEMLTPEIDQAALRGLLSTLFNLNIRVIAVVPITWEAPEVTY
jgi:hypothetical protein